MDGISLPADERGHPDPPPEPKPGFLAAALRVHLFVIQSAVPILLFEVVLLLAVLGRVGGGFGAFHVVWRPAPGEWWANVLLSANRAMAWNGAAVGVYFCTSAYLVYLLYARTHRAAAWGWERLYLYGGKAAPPVLLATLPVWLPIDPYGDGLGYWERVAERLPFLLGLIVGCGLFVWLVEQITTVGFIVIMLSRSPEHRADQKSAVRWFLRRLDDVNDALFWVARRLDRLTGGWAKAAKDAVAGFVRPRIRADKPVAARQADGLFAVVLFVYAGLVGYTLADAAGVSARTLLPLPAAAAVAALAVWAWAVARRPGDAPEYTAGRYLGLAAVGVAVAGVAALVYWHEVRTAQGFDWPHVVIAVGVILTAVPAVRALADDATSAQSVAYVAAAVFWAAAGGAAGYAGGLGYGLLFGTTGVVALPAATSVCLLLAVFAVAYGVLRFYAGDWFYPAGLAIAGALLTIGALRPYPHHLEELAAHYGRPADTDIEANKPKLDKYAAYRAAAAALPAGDAKRPLADADAVRAWQAALTAGRPGVQAVGGGVALRKPPMVLVTTAGGASVSALYTFRVPSLSTPGRDPQ